MISGLMLAAVMGAGPTVSVQFEGPMNLALKEIATRGQLNLLVAGELTQPVQVSLSNVTADEAIESVAKAYGLELRREGKMIIVRPSVAAPVAAAATPAPTPAPGATGAPDEAAETEALAARAEAAREAAEALREKAEAARDRAESVRESMEDLKAAVHDRAEAMKEATRAQVEAAKAQAAAERARTGNEHDVVAGGPVSVAPGAHVDSAVSYGGSVTLGDGAVVAGDAVAMGGDVVLGKNAEVEGDAVAMGGRVILAEGARVHGEQVSLGASSFGTSVARGAIKAGSAVAKNDSASDDSKNDEPDHFSPASFLVNFAFLFAVGFLMLVFAPQRMKNIEASIRAQPVLNGVIGMGALLLAIPVTVLLCVTIIGIPVALIGWLLTALAVPVAVAAVANQIGSAVPTGRLRKTQALVLALGLLIVMLSGLVPYLGPLVVAAVIMVGLGAMARSRFGRPAAGTPIVESAGYIDSAPAI